MSDILGWLAAGLTVATFSCVQPVPLRLCALAANLAFIAYGISAGLWPVLALHAVLLPINARRLLQAGGPRPRAGDAAAGPPAESGAASPLASRP